MVNDLSKKSGAGGEIKKVIALGIAFCAYIGQGLCDPGVELRIVKLSTNVINPLQHPVTKFRINRAGGEALQLLSHDFPVLLRGVIVAAYSHDCEVSGKQLGLDQVIKRGE